VPGELDNVLREVGRRAAAKMTSSPTADSGLSIKAAEKETA
jgi:hypothetical protein